MFVRCMLFFLKLNLIIDSVVTQGAPPSMLLLSPCACVCLTSFPDARSVGRYRSAQFASVHCDKQALRGGRRFCSVRLQFGTAHDSLTQTLALAALWVRDNIMTYSVSQPCFRLLTLVLQCNQGYGSIYRVLYCLYMYNTLYTCLFTITVVLRHSERLVTLALVLKGSSLFFSGVFHSISSDFSCVKSKNRDDTLHSNTCLL